MPKVSVVIPTYNRAKYICETIDSVLNQTFQDFEIIIVNDGSSDNTESLVLEYIRKYPNRMKYVYQQNKGEAAARNTGIMKSDGEYIAFLDSDDIWLEQKLEKQIDYVKKTDTDLVYCSMFIMENGVIDYKKIKPANPAFTFLDLLLGGKSITTPTVLVKKRCIQKVEPFDETLKLACDYEMWLRFSLKYKISFIDESLAIYRIHSSQLSSDDNDKEFKEHGVTIFKKLIAYPELPRKLVKKKLSREYYLLGKIYYEKKQYKLAFKSIGDSLCVNPLVGISFFDPKDGMSKKIKKIIKPFLLFFILIFLSKKDLKIWPKSA